MVINQRYRILLLAVSLGAMAWLGHISAAWADDDTDSDSAFSSLDDTDRALRQVALKAVLTGPLAGRRHWSNIDSGHDGTLKAISDRPDKQGRTCRTISETLSSGSDVAHGSTVACHTATAGRWQIVRSTMNPFEPVPADLESGGGMAMDTPDQVPADMPPSAAQSAQIPIQVWIDGENYRRGGRMPQPGQGSTPGGAKSP